MSLTLGLDTATPDTTCAVCEGGEVVAERGAGPGPDGRPRHAAALLETVEAALAEAGGWDLVGLIAVGIGPGSFTGIRIGVATARALAQGRGLPLAPVRTTDALAAAIGAAPGVAVIDARRGEVFAAVADASGPASEPVVCAPGDVAPLLGLVGGRAAGDGAIRFRGELEAAGFEVPDDGDPVHRLSARHVCILGEAAPALAPEDVRPMYLRRPDADRWHERDRHDPDPDRGP